MVYVAQSCKILAISSKFVAMVLPDNTISSLSDHILNIILIRYIERDLSRPSMGGILTLSHGGSV